MLLKPYFVPFLGKLHEFKQLGEAFLFCDEWGLPYPERIFEPDGQPHIRASLITGENIKKNRQRIIANAKEARQNEISNQHRA